MRKLLVLLMLALTSSKLFAQQTPLLQLRCEGYEEEQASSDLESSGRKSREATTFTLRVQPDTGLAQITGLALYATLSQDKPFRFTISDTTLSYEGEFVPNEPKGHVKSSLSIDRYSGVAHESQIISAEKAHVLRIITGEYKCESLKDKLF